MEPRRQTIKAIRILSSIMRGVMENLYDKEFPKR